MKKARLIISVLLVTALVMGGMLTGCTSPSNEENDSGGAASASRSESTGTASAGSASTGTASSGSGSGSASSASQPTITNIGELSSAQVGDIVSFGEITIGIYDNQTYKENTAWQVLAIADGKVLIMTVEEIDRIAWNRSEVNREVIPAVWADCSLRAYLNNDFYNVMPQILKDAAAPTQIVNGPNPVAGTDGGANTEDKVFLLSAEEVGQFLPDQAKRESKRDWWTRTIGDNGSKAVYVYDDGTIDTRGTALDADRYSSLPGVRPALWVTVG